MKKMRRSTKKYGGSRAGSGRSVISQLRQSGAVGFSKEMTEIDRTSDTGRVLPLLLISGRMEEHLAADRVGAATLAITQCEQGKPGAERKTVNILEADAEMIRQSCQEKKDEQTDATRKKEVDASQEKQKNRRVSRSQCRRCGYRWSDGNIVICQYILVEGHSRPDPVDGYCPVRVVSALPFGCGSKRDGRRKDD